MRLLATFLAAFFVVSATSCDRGPRSGPTAEPPKTDRANSLYSVEATKTAVPVGEATPVELTIRPGAGWKINKLFDWKFEFEPSDGITLDKSSVGSADIALDDAKASIPVTVTPRKSGTVELPATGSFSVCNDTQCELFEDVEVTFAINTSAP